MRHIRPARRQSAQQASCSATDLVFLRVGSCRLSTRLFIWRSFITSHPVYGRVRRPDRGPQLTPAHCGPLFTQDAASTTTKFVVADCVHRPEAINADAKMPATRQGVYALAAKNFRSAIASMGNCRTIQHSRRNIHPGFRARTEQRSLDGLSTSERRCRGRSSWR